MPSESVLWEAERLAEAAAGSARAREWIARLAEAGAQPGTAPREVLEVARELIHATDELRCASGEQLSDLHGQLLRHAALATEGANATLLAAIESLWTAVNNRWGRAARMSQR